MRGIEKEFNSGKQTVTAGKHDAETVESIIIMFKQQFTVVYFKVAKITNQSLVYLVDNIFTVEIYNKLNIRSE